ncbi:MAG: ATP-binding protein [Anaerococcus sp.]|nr:ATP-binding protein [Peptoniphilaceae bacterium]MDY3056146.1 ATP-binding protein [Anaerococcus sp.]
MIDREKNDILVCISPAKTNKLVIEEAQEMAEKEGARLIALYVSPEKSLRSASKKENLQKNLDYAEKLGTMVEIIYANDIASQIVNYARINKVKRIVLGRNRNQSKLLSFSKSISDQVLEMSDNIDVHMIPVNGSIIIGKLDEKNNYLIDSLIALVILFVATIIGRLFFRYSMGIENIIMVYILGIFFISLITYNEIVCMGASVLTVLAFNFFFTQPTMSLTYYDPSYLITFIVLLIVSLISSRLTSRLRKNEQDSAKEASVTKLLLDTNQLLQTKITQEEIIDTGCRQVSDLLRKDVVYYNVREDMLLRPKFYKISDNDKDESLVFLEEKEVAEWVLAHNKSAGASTRYLSDAKYIYYAVRRNAKACGVLGIYLDKDRLDSVENKIVLAILGDMALALEKEKNLRDKNEVALKVKDEELKANLLRSISHDLRTPLTSIYGNSDILLHNGENLPLEMKNNLYKDIYEDSQWLLNLIENLLSVTKVEDRNMKLKMEPQMIEEVIDEAMKHISKDKKDHHIETKIEGDYLMAKMDVRLIIQVIINIINNAIKYSPSGSKILVRGYKKKGKVMIEISDDGPGVNDEDKKKIFEKFYSVTKSTISDSKRSIGLGLYLCKIIVEAHGGEIWVEDNKPQGAKFIISLKSLDTDSL